MLRVRFQAKASLPFGDNLYLVGSVPSLGGWNVDRALKCAWQAGDVWSCEALLPEHNVINYKFVVKRQDGRVQWQPGEDSTTLASRGAVSVAADQDLLDALRLDVVRVSSQLPFGDTFVLVGDHENLGAWDPEQGLAMQWTEGDVWQVSAALPRDQRVEYKLVRVCRDGHAHWMQGDNGVVEPMSSLAIEGDTETKVLPVTRHIHHRAGSWFMPWYWAPELSHTDAVVQLVDPLDVPLTLEEGVAAAMDVAALVEARASSIDSLTGKSTRTVAETEDATRKALEALQRRMVQASQKVDKKAAAATAAVVTAGVGAKATGVAGLAAFGAMVDESLLVAVQPAMEWAVVGAVLGLGTRNLLFAKDRKKFMAALTDRGSFMKLLEENAMALGMMPEPEDKQRIIFDPLNLANGGDAPKSTKLSIGATLLPMQDDALPLPLNMEQAGDEKHTRQGAGAGDGEATGRGEGHGSVQ